MEMYYWAALARMTNPPTQPVVVHTLSTCSHVPATVKYGPAESYTYTWRYR